MYRYAAVDYAHEFQRLLDQRILDKKERERNKTNNKKGSQKWEKK